MQWRYRGDIGEMGFISMKASSTPYLVRGRALVRAKPNLNALTLTLNTLIP